MKCRFCQCTHLPTVSCNITVSHLLGTLFCFSIGICGLDVGPLIVVIVIVVLWSHWEECYYAYKWTSELNIIYLHCKITAVKDEETVNWVNFVVDKWWSTCDDCVTKFVKDWIEPIIERFKVAIIVESIRIMSFNVGPSRTEFKNVKLVQRISEPSSVASTEQLYIRHIFVPITSDKLFRSCVFSRSGKVLFGLETDANFNAPCSDFKMKARVGSKKFINQDLLLNVDCFHVNGRIQCVVELDRNAVFPHVSNVTLCFVSAPIIKVSCRMLKDKLDVTDTPIIKQMMEKYIEYGFRKEFVYPSKQYVDFTPTPPPAPNWKCMNLSVGFLTVKFECRMNLKKNGTFYFVFELGDQKIQTTFLEKFLSSTFSYLIHDLQIEKFSIFLKQKRKVLQDIILAQQEISLDDFSTTVKSTIEKQVNFNTDEGIVYLFFTLTYTPLVPISLLEKSSVAPKHVNASGVLFIYVHAVKNLNLYGEAYCTVKFGSDGVFKTPIVHCFQSAIWECGREILIPCINETRIVFEVYQCSIFGLDSCCGSATVLLNGEKTELIQESVLLNGHLGEEASIIFTIIFRSIENVNYTCFGLRKTNGVDNTTKYYMNSLIQGHQSTTVESVPNASAAKTVWNSVLHSTVELN